MPNPELRASALVDHDREPDGVRWGGISPASVPFGSDLVLRQYMSLVPTSGMKVRRASVPRNTGARVTARNASPLVQQHDPCRFELFCNLGL